jgi:hypothetical protein
MKESTLYKLSPKRFPEYTPKIKSADKPVYDRPLDFPQDASVETVIADDEFAPPRLTRQDFEAAAIIARKKQNVDSGSNVPVTGFPLIDAKNIETVIADDEFAPPRLTRQDFTEESIEKARARLSMAYKGEEDSESLLADSSVEMAGVSVPEKLRLTREDFPGTGSEKMPKLVFKKKDSVSGEKKSFFKRLLPSFIAKRFFH